MKRLHLSVPKLPGLGLASFRRRILFRSAFVLLIAATLGLAIALLKEEKQRSYDNYQQSFRKTQAEIMARLRHPAGQLALLNPDAQGGAVTPLSPLVLPYAALDFDELNKAQQAVEMAGCSVQYENGNSLCVAIGSNPYAGGFIYLVGSFADGTLVSHEGSQTDIGSVHRARVSLDMRGTHSQWLAPFEAQNVVGGGMLRGRLTGFTDTEASEFATLLPSMARPVRDFRGWLWQGNQCVDPQAETGCLKRAYFSIRLPVEAFTAELFLKRLPTWPPADLNDIKVHLEMFGPNASAPLFDSNAPSATPPLSLNGLAQTLLPGEQLHIRKLNGNKLAQKPITLKADEEDETLSPWLHKLVRHLPVDGYTNPLEGREVIRTAVGSYEVVLSGDVRSIDRSISIVATRMLWFVGAMLAAIVLAWLLIEIGLIRRIAVLTKRAAAVSYNVQDARVEHRLSDLDLSDLRGRDELGILASGLDDLLQRVKDDVQREHIRAQQERDMWQAVGHEIMSPLQSLMVLHPDSNDTSHRYVQRMQQAVRVLYGTASPSEALEAATLQLGAIDLNEFLQHIAANAPFAGIDNVQFTPAELAMPARADEFSLEDVVTHILRNADRYRLPGSPIVVSLEEAESVVLIRIHNQGPAIDANMLDKIFEYGVSDSEGHDNGERRGQGLFVAKTYMAKMGGTITAENVAEGVAFTLTLQRAAA
ncbi:MAG TPA: HAMP domain-containing sensor histidine kinase [Rhodocyclaceae bacterium]|nr:HAMP domain-containing sensor histidine kinase [Rhodocyclaceae bacterium]